MPWKTNDDLPSSVRGALPAEAQTRFRTVANAAMERGAGDTSAIRQAWHVVGIGWKKTDNGWVRKVLKSMYVHRKVQNGEQLQRWAKGQGFATTLPPEDMHVTVAYSKKPVEWDNMGSSAETVRIPPGQDRDVIKLGKGDETAAVLRFNADPLLKRWEDFIGKGASWDHDGYRPHVSISYNHEGMNLDAVRPYSGAIHLGPEHFGEVKSDWHDRITEKSARIEKLAGQLRALGIRIGMKDLDFSFNKRPQTPPPRKFVKASVAKVDSELGLVFGWAIICKQDGSDYYDLQDDHIPEDAMLEAATDFMAESRVAKDMHDGDPIGSIVFAFPMTAETAKAMGVTSKRTGLMVAMKPSADVLAKFKSGEYTGFSIGGTRIKDEAAA